MYLDFLVNIPNAPGKITYRRKNDVCDFSCMDTGFVLYSI